MINFEWLDNLIPYYKFATDNLKKDCVFLVGGIIRDLLIWKQKDNFTDIDITCSTEPEKLYSKIDKKDIHIFKTDKFGTITILPQNKSCQYEITPFRTEGVYTDVRHPSELEWTDNLWKDSLRRDFTINCLYYTYIKFEEEKVDKTNLKTIFSKSLLQKLSNTFIIKDNSKDILLKRLKSRWIVYIKDYNLLVIQNQEIIENITKNGNLDKKILASLINLDNIDDLHIIIDPHGGINDILRQKLKAVGNPDDRFQEDALRVIRAIRFIAILNEEENLSFDFDPETWWACKKNYYLVDEVAKERIVQEIIKVFKIWNAFGFIWMMEELNLLKYIFPALDRTIWNKQPTRYHPLDTYSHSILCLYHLQNINSNYLVRFGMLYHDVGKPDQYYWAGIKMKDEDRQKLYSSYINHPVVWADLTQKDFRRLWFSKKEIEEIVFYVRYHLLPGELLQMSEKNRKKRINRYISKYGIDMLLNLCDICIGDRQWQYNPLQKTDDKSIFDLKEEIRKIYKDIWRITLKDIVIDGNILMEEFEIERGPKLGEILKKLLELVLEDPTKNEKKTLMIEVKRILNEKTKRLEGRKNL